MLPYLLEVAMNRQRTIANTVEIAGHGVHWGKPAKLRLHPAPADSGICMRRTDSGGPLFPVNLDHVLNASQLNTTVGTSKEHAISTVEHLMAAIRGAAIDNLLIEVDGPEIPILDGSAAPFLAALQQATIQDQAAPRRWYSLEAPIAWSAGEVAIAAFPAEEFRISYTLSYPGHPLLGAQFFSTVVEPTEFEREIARCRTFVCKEELEHLRSLNLIKGGSLDCAVVIDGATVINAEGLRCHQEPVKHKILDMVGDLFLTGVWFKAHVVSLRSGHASNFAFASELLKALR